MSGQNYLNVALESVFSTAPTTGWHGMAVTDLGGHKVDVRHVQPETMTFGQQGKTVRGRRTLLGGAAGTLKPYLESSGLLPTLQAVFGAPVRTVLAADEAFEYVFTTKASASAASLAVQVGRDFKSGSRDRDTLVGGQPTELRFMQGMLANASGTSEEGLAKVEVDVNYRRLDTAVIERLPTYSNPEVVYSAGDFTFFIGEDLANLDAECINTLSIKAPTGISTDLECIAQFRDLAVRGAWPEPTMDAAWTYKGREYLDAHRNGTILAARSRWEPVEIWLDEDETIHPSFQVDVPAFGFTGEEPEPDRQGTTKQNLPMEILHNEVDPMITITVVTSDAAV